MILAPVIGLITVIAVTVFSHVHNLLGILCSESADHLTDYTFMMVKFSQYFAVSIYFVIYETLYILRQGSIYWGGRGEASPKRLSFPPKSFTEKKITAISNKGLF